ncbi:MAG: 5'-nucleotidase C-terminal domain-containing protein [Gemmatimonadota bacterium]|nr:5'-nucleotidase C-terminal domain-containing protein [Gemmatimonadota bacterium]
MAEAYRRDIADLVERVVAELAEPLSKPRRGDFPLGRLIADAQRAATGAQVAVMNNGGIRVPLEAGPVTYADLFEVQPFGNTLVRLRLSGANLLAALEHALEDEGTGAQVSGLTVRYDPDAPRGEAILEARLRDGTLRAADEVYDVTVNDFMATGGAGYTMFLEAESADFTGIVDLEALVAYLEGLPQPVRAPSDQRWIPVTSP